jgi:hypothetical protein
MAASSAGGENINGNINNGISVISAKINKSKISIMAK